MAGLLGSREVAVCNWLKRDKARRDVGPNFVDAAKRVLADDEAVLFGIFGVIGTSGYFPPSAFLNEFFMHGNDPCDQDGRMKEWTPFTLSPEEYREVFSWWVLSH